MLIYLAFLKIFIIHNIFIQLGQLRGDLRLIQIGAGVGGIDSWGSDVEEPWHIDGESDITYSSAIVPAGD